MDISPGKEQPDVRETPVRTSFEIELLFRHGGAIARIQVYAPAKCLLEGFGERGRRAYLQYRP